MKLPMLQLKPSIQLPFMSNSNGNNQYNEKLSSPEANGSDNQFSSESLTPQSDVTKMVESSDSKANLKSCISNQASFSLHEQSQQQQLNLHLHHQNQSSNLLFFFFSFYFCCCSITFILDKLKSKGKDLINPLKKKFSQGK